MHAKVRRLRFAPSRWVVLSVAVVIAAVGGVRVVPWAAATTSSGDRAIFEPLPPVRILDTRSPVNPLGPGESRLLQITGAGGVALDATAVVLNVTAVSPTAAGWLTLYPSDAASVPVVSNLNFSAGQVVPNLTTVRLGATGAIKIFNQAGNTHVLADVAGYYRGHDHDDRYYVKAQTQARLVANSLTCPAGQFLNTVAANGAPTCGVDVRGRTDPYEIVGPINTIVPSSTFVFAGPVAPVTIVAGQTVLTSVSGVIGSTTNGTVDFATCRRAVPGGSIVLDTPAGYLTTALVANEREVISSTFPTQPEAGTWDFGLCIRSSTTLNLNDFVNGAVTVFT